VAPFVDFGCDGDMRPVKGPESDPTYGGTETFTAMDPDGPLTIVSITMVANVFTTNGCQVSVTRTWEVEDCCGLTHQATESYEYNLTPTDIQNDMLPDLMLGCIASEAMIPGPDFIAAGTMAECGDLAISLTSSLPIPAPTSTSVGAFTGGDVGEGLDLDGEMIYAIDLGGPGGMQVRNAKFVPVTAPGIAIVAPRNIFSWGPGTRNYGASLNDDKLESMMRSIRWAAPPGEMFNLDLSNLQVGCRYKVQLLFQDSVGSSRNFDVYAEGALLADNFSTAGGSAAGVVLTHEYTAGDGILNLVLGGTPNAGGDRNPILNAMTLERIPDCSQAIERVYEVAAACAVSSVTQVVMYAIDTAPPMITTAPFVDYACAGDQRVFSNPICPDPTYDGAEAFTVTDPDGTCGISQPRLVSENRVAAGCKVTVSRVWEVEDCCGNVVQATETYAYENKPEKLVSTVRVYANVTRLTINEIEIFDETGANIALGATASSPYGADSGSSVGGVNDGVISLGCCAGLWHPPNGSVNTYVDLDLAAPSYVNLIAVTPRLTCCPRLSNFAVILYDADGNECWREDRVNAACGGNETCNVQPAGYVTQNFSPSRSYEPLGGLAPCALPGVDAGCIDTLGSLPAVDLSGITACEPPVATLVSSAPTTDPINVVCVSGSDGFSYADFGDPAPAGGELDAGADATFEICFSPDAFVAGQASVIWETGDNINGSGLYLYGDDLILATSRNGTQRLITIDLQAMAVIPGTDYLCAYINFDVDAFRR